MENRDPQLPALPNEVRQELRKTARDRLAAYAQAAVSGAPWIGPVVAEAIGEIIPNQRIDRIADMLSHLDGRMHRLENAEAVRERMRSPEGIDLLEDGMLQAVQALSEDRREQIAALLANSLADDELEHLQKKRLLELFEEMNDAEILILQSYALLPDEARRFREEHAAAISRTFPHLGSGQDELDQAALQDAFVRKLTSLGLLRPRYVKPTRTRPVEFDFKTGTIKSQGHEITPLGRLLLRYLDMRVDM